MSPITSPSSIAVRRFLNPIGGTPCDVAVLLVVNTGFLLSNIAAIYSEMTKIERSYIERGAESALTRVVRDALGGGHWTETKTASPKASQVHGFTVGYHRHRRPHASFRPASPAAPQHSNFKVDNSSIHPFLCPFPCRSLLLAVYWCWQEPC